jgi:RimJ/RimL family protein N-acetyltransferase
MLFSKNNLIKKNIKLKILLPKHVSKKYVRWLNDQRVIRHTSFANKKQSKKDISRYVEEKKKSNFEKLFGIFYKNIHIGNCKFGPINFKKSFAEISYFIGEKKMLGKGIATYAVYRFLILAKKLNLQIIYASVKKKNLASISVLKKNKFIRILNNPHKIYLDSGDVLFRKKIH